MDLTFKKTHDYAIQRFTIDKEAIKVLVYRQNNDIATLLTRIEAFVTLQAIKAIRILFGDNLDVVDYKIHQSWNKEWIYSSLITKQGNNHPFVVMANLNNNWIDVLRPFGRDHGHVSIKHFDTIFDSKYSGYFTKAEYYAFYVLFSESIRMRKLEMLYNTKHSLLKCDNIKQCLLKKHELMEMRGIPASDIQAELVKWQKYYEKKSIVFISRYFDLLDSRNYQEALEFLKMKKGDAHYRGKQRLDTFFVSSREIIGHLHIFIEIYQFIYLAIDRFKYL